MQSKHPALVLCMAAPEDTSQMVQWERHLLPLQQAGHLRLWSERLLLAGEDRLPQMVQHLDQADLIVFLLSPDFFASEEHAVLLERALTLQQNKQVTLVPLLLRPSAWQDSPLGSLSCLPSNRRPVTIWRNVDEAFQTCVEGIRQFLGLPMNDGASKRQPPLPHRQRLQMIRRLRQEYRQRLDHSLQGQVVIELDLHERVDVIASSARLVFHDTETEPLLEGTTIIQVYDRAQFGMLILGAPGAGKTTLLLDLVLELLPRAENDPEHPLPIILSLSSWATKKLALADWLSEQLCLVYGIAKKVGASWIEQDQLLFLLDGLDEMDVSARTACIAAMNRYREEHFVPLVVASRNWEYEQQHARLVLPVAVEIQPLEMAKVMIYLTQASPALAIARTAVQTNPTLQQLMTTPLMLMIVLLTYRDQEARELPKSGSPKDQQQQIFQHYIQRMLLRHQHRRKFSARCLLFSLRRLAQQMQQQRLTEFYLENLQATWIAARALQIIYQLLVGLVAGAVVTLVFALFFALLFGQTSGLIIGLVCGLLFGLSQSLGEITPIGALVWSWEKARKKLIWYLIGSCTSVPIAVYLGVQTNDLISVLVFTLIFALLIMLFLILHDGLLGAPIDVDIYRKPNQGIHNSGWNALCIGIITMLSTGVFCGTIALLPVFLPTLLKDGEHSRVASKLIFFLFVGLIMLFFGLYKALIFGGYAYLKHYLLRVFLWRNGMLPWHATAFLDEATNCLLLQRVGGGYRFIHPLLQEYFASLDVEAVLGQSEG